MQVLHKLVAGNTVYAFLRNLEPVLSPWLERNEKTFKISNLILYLFIIIEGPHQLVSCVFLTCFSKYSYVCMHVCMYACMRVCMYVRLYWTAISD